MPNSPVRKVLIVSSHALFSKGLQQLLTQHTNYQVQIVGVVSTLEAAQQVMATQTPDLTIVDYDDEQVNRREFIEQFIQDEQQQRLVLLSLQEGGDQGMVYERRQVVPSQIDSWLESWFEPSSSKFSSSFHPKTQE